MASPDDFMGEPGMDEDWNPSEFMFDSPQPSNPLYNSDIPTFAAGSAPTPSFSQSLQAATPASEQTATESQALPHLSVPQQIYSAPSSASEESSSQSSSSAESSARRKRKTSSTSSPHALFGGGTVPPTIDEASASDFKMDRMMTDMDDTYAFEDSTFPMGTGMDNLSLDPMTNTPVATTFDFGSAQESSSGFTPGPFADTSSQSFMSKGLVTGNAERSLNRSPEVMTAHPSKFMIGDSREDSPSSANMFTSQESSPANFMSSNSPFSGNVDAFGTGFSTGSNFAGLNFNASPLNFNSMNRGWSGSGPTITSPSAHSPGANWPCRLSVDKIPEKSRVETQIPIKLWLSPMPEGVSKLHLPTHTISKPKLLQKPSYSKAEDTLELSTMLVCASAMMKEGNLERAYQRATTDEAPLKREEGRRNSTGDIQFDENDPNKPLNGGPVNICQGCITRERKRAARKKNKKAEEEEAWAKDEAKRVIVFNTNEVKEWVSPSGHGEMMVPESMPDAMSVEAPMRIACYCRHQSEKLGFQVIFTIKTSAGQVLAQTISDSIMITDDHKQPTAQPQPQAGIAVPASAPYDTSMFSPGSAFGMMPTIQQAREPFKNSWSTNDLQAMARNFAPQPQPPPIRKQYSAAQAATVSRTTSTTMTPRNLSRPASPTDPQGHSVKKRRSDGPSYAKIPASLTMTRRDNTISPNSASSQGPTSAGPTSGTFSFPSSAGPFGPPMDSFQSSTLNVGTQYYNGHQMSSSAYASPTIEQPPFQYSTAPSSQHASRAPSPDSVARLSTTPSQTLLQQAATAVLSGMPPQRPSISQIIPTEGPTSGGTEVTILGSNFVKGVEVMFGDNVAQQTGQYGDSALVVRTPPATRPGYVYVMFEHEREMSPPAYPQRRAHFNYKDQDKSQMLALAGMIVQQGTNGRNISQENLQQMMSGYQTGGFSNFQGAGGQTSRNQFRQASDKSLESCEAAASEESMMAWLDFVDMNDSPLQPNFNTALPSGVTLLMLASRVGYTRFVAGLLARGANPNSRDKSGFTALMAATMMNHAPVVRHLTVKGADPSIRSLRGYSASDFCKSNDVLAVLTQIMSSPRPVLWEDSSSIYRRPSSSPSLDTISALSTSSQLSLPGTIASEDTSDLDQDQLWMSVKRKKEPPTAQTTIHSRFINANGQVQWMTRSPTAAWAAWREQVVTQIHHLQQNLLWNMPSLQFPGLPPLPDYHHNPVVRRLSDLLSVPSSPISPPPSYEDACAGSHDDKQVAKESRLHATVGAILDMKCKYALSTTTKSASAASTSTLIAPNDLHAGIVETTEIDRDMTSILARQSSDSVIQRDSKYAYMMVSLMLVTLGWLLITPAVRFNVVASYIPFCEQRIQSMRS